MLLNLKRKFISKEYFFLDQIYSYLILKFISTKLKRFLLYISFLIRYISTLLVNTSVTFIFKNQGIFKNVNTKNVNTL